MWFGQKKRTFFLAILEGSGDLFEEPRVSYKKRHISDKKTGELIKKREENLLVKKKDLPLQRDG